MIKQQKTIITLCNSIIADVISSQLGMEDTRSTEGIERGYGRIAYGKPELGDITENEIIAIYLQFGILQLLQLGMGIKSDRLH